MDTQTKLRSTDELNRLFPSIADSYDCATENNPVHGHEQTVLKAKVDAYAQTVMAEVRTTIAKRNALQKAA